MRAIFADINGVLNCKSTPNPRKLPYVIDHKLLERFQQLVERTGAEVILSSTWRYDPAGLFSARYWGIPFSDVTPDLPGKPRRDEILGWLERRPDVVRFAIIDDEDDGLDDLPLFQPSCRTGLTEQIAKGVEAYLTGATDKDMRCGRMQRFFQNLGCREGPSRLSKGRHGRCLGQILGARLPGHGDQPAFEINLVPDQRQQTTSAKPLGSARPA